MGGGVVLAGQVDQKFNTQPGLCNKVLSKVWELGWGNTGERFDGNGKIKRKIHTLVAEFSE